MRKNRIDCENFSCNSYRDEVEYDNSPLKRFSLTSTNGIRKESLQKLLETQNAGFVESSHTVFEIIIKIKVSRLSILEALASLGIVSKELEENEKKSALYSVSNRFIRFL